MNEGFELSGHEDNGLHGVHKHKLCEHLSRPAPDVTMGVIDCTDTISYQKWIVYHVTRLPSLL